MTDRVETVAEMRAVATAKLLAETVEAVNRAVSDVLAFDNPTVIVSRAICAFSAFNRAYIFYIDTVLFESGEAISQAHRTIREIKQAIESPRFREAFIRATKATNPIDFKETFMLAQAADTAYESAASVGDDVPAPRAVLANKADQSDLIKCESDTDGD